MSSSDRLDIAVLSHESDSPVGFFGSWAAERGHVVQVIDVPTDGALPPLDEQGLVVTLGSKSSVHASTEPWLQAELNYLREAETAEVPVLGICFGSQILAAARGGSVEPAAITEPGWQEIASSDPDLVPAGPWLCWHDDVFTVPPGAVELARDGAGALAFRSGSDVGLQFHPEVERAVVAHWIEIAAGRLSESDLSRLREELRVTAPRARALAFDLFDRLSSLWLKA